MIINIYLYRNSVDEAILCENFRFYSALSICNFSVSMKYDFQNCRCHSYEDQV